MEVTYSVFAFHWFTHYPLFFCFLPCSLRYDNAFEKSWKTDSEVLPLISPGKILELFEGMCRNLICEILCLFFSKLYIAVYAGGFIPACFGLNFPFGE